ncbi:MAG: acyl-CoA dehydrogenase family protein [Hyphomonadaceae bacterium]|nr:acyl-CoA dehydrogenase family protein [Hyphomonadaceae bacterium]
MDQGNIGEMITDTARRVLGDYAAASARAKDAWNPALWKDLEEAGLTAAWEHGSGGPLGSPVEAAFAIMRVAAEHAVCAPLAETMLANYLAQSCGLEAPNGPMSVAPVRRTDALSLERVGSGWRLRGAVGRVPWGEQVGYLAIHAALDGEDYLAIAPGRAVKGASETNIAGEPRANLEIDAELPATSVAIWRSKVGLRHLGALVRATQIAGAMEATLALTIEYASTRVQFGRQLRKFQVIQHYLATMASQSAAARVSVDVAVRALGRPQCESAIAAAKIRAGEAVRDVARLAHQIHGAIGFTQDYRLQSLTRRLWSWRDEFGTEAEWAHDLGSQVCRSGADKTWALLTEQMA